MKNLITILILIFTFNGCAISSNNNRLSLNDEQRYCNEFYAFSRALLGDSISHEYQNNTTKQYAKAEVKFYEILSSVVKTGKISKQEHTEFWASINELQKFHYIEKECIDKYPAMMGFLSEFYRSAKLSYENKSIVKTQGLTKILNHPSQLRPKSCYYADGEKYNRLYVATHLPRVYRQELSEFKKCFAPYNDMLLQISQRKDGVSFSTHGGRLVNTYEFNQDAYKQIAEHAKKAEESLKILLNKNYQ
ncbi:hypothetical protein [Campylobacter sp. RM9328]|uniref:hypothetical protein n=1 Tax=Campylobacter sp. RM9328 TaxID=1705720 RepID=UPI001473F4E3|nr:hypothetical protein [Campylobacter sp. RM9328]